MEGEEDLLNSALDIMQIRALQQNQKKKTSVLTPRPNIAKDSHDWSNDPLYHILII